MRQALALALAFALAAVLPLPTQAASERPIRSASGKAGRWRAASTRVRPYRCG